MDLNYLLHRQQVERSRAEAATAEQTRAAHEAMARKYEERINELTSDEFIVSTERIAGGAINGEGS